MMCMGGLTSASAAVSVNISLRSPRYSGVYASPVSRSRLAAVTVSRVPPLFGTNIGGPISLNVLAACACGAYRETFIRSKEAFFPAVP